MTPNIEKLIGPILLQGSFVPALSSAALAVFAKKDEMDPILHLLLRDDIVSWYTSKSSPRTDAKTQELEKQLLDRVNKNTSLVQSRFRDCSPEEARNSDAGRVQPIDQKVRDLITAATSSEKLCMLPHGYQGWL